MHFQHLYKIKSFHHYCIQPIYSRNERSIFACQGLKLITRYFVRISIYWELEFLCSRRWNNYLFISNCKQRQHTSRNPSSKEPLTAMKIKQKILCLANEATPHSRFNPALCRRRRSLSLFSQELNPTVALRKNERPYGASLSSSTPLRLSPSIRLREIMRTQDTCFMSGYLPGGGCRLMRCLIWNGWQRHINSWAGGNSFWSVCRLK